MAPRRATFPVGRSGVEESDVAGSSALLEATGQRLLLERLACIRLELDEAIERRNALWSDATLNRADQREAITREIDELWHELRSVRAEALHVPREQILGAAQVEARMERRLSRLRRGSAQPAKRPPGRSS